MLKEEISPYLDAFLMGQSENCTLFHLSRELRMQRWSSASQQSLIRNPLSDKFPWLSGLCKHSQRYKYSDKIVYCIASRSPWRCIALVYHRVIGRYLSCVCAIETLSVRWGWASALCSLMFPLTNRQRDGTVPWKKDLKKSSFGVSSSLSHLTVLHIRLCDYIVDYVIQYQPTNVEVQWSL